MRGVSGRSGRTEKLVQTGDLILVTEVVHESIQLLDGTLSALVWATVGLFDTRGLIPCRYGLVRLCCLGRRTWRSADDPAESVALSQKEILLRASLSRRPDNLRPVKKPDWAFRSFLSINLAHIFSGPPPGSFLNAADSLRGVPIARGINKTLSAGPLLPVGLDG